MNERGILFSAPMVLALLAGKKTQTRRVATERDREAGRCPIAAPGDRLWVRETWAPMTSANPPCATEYWYRASTRGDAGRFKWKPAIHMPREASRILLAVNSIRVERLKALTEADAVAEGMHPDRSGVRGDDLLAVAEFMRRYDMKAGRIGAIPAPVARYALLWDSINGKPGKNWNANPWVWVVQFTRISP
jgi:hypothetical protein